MEREGLMASLDLNQRKQDIQNACHNLNVASGKGQWVKWSNEITT
jgi:hypothetical protein